MAIRIPIITDLQDKGIKEAKAAFNDFKKSVANAEGGLGKFKAGSKSIFNAVEANAVAFGTAAAAAIGTFAFKAIGEFQDLALAAGKFSDASGLAVEDASRYIEAAGDIGIPVDKLETAIGKLNKTIGADPDKVRDLGVDLVYLRDGSLDVNETFLNTIDRIKGIKDPAEKAKVASELLGKGWKDMAELIHMGSDDLKASLDSVSDQKIIDENEVRRARNFRDSMDQLRGKFEDITLAVGEKLLPVVQNLLDKAVALSEVELPGWMQSLATAAEVTAKTIVMGPVDAIKSMNVASEEVIKQNGPFSQMLSNATDKFEGLAGAAEEAADEITATDDAWKRLKGSLEVDSQMISAREQLKELQETAVEAYGGSAEALAEYEQGLINAKLMVLNLAENINLSNSQQNYLRVLVDTGEIEKALDMLDLVKAGGYTDATNAMRFRGTRTADLSGLKFGGARASGGPVMAGGSYLVGERGPELFTPGTSGNITPNNALGGGNITVNVTSANPDDVVAALQRWVRNNGSLALSTTAGVRF